MEDNEDDVFFMQVAVKRLALPHVLEVARDGREAKHRLERFLAGRTDPDPLGLILLDLNLPYLGGLELLAWMSTAAGSRLFPPAVILSTSEKDSDLDTAARLGAAAFMLKPNRPDELVALLRTLDACWLSGTCPPPQAGAMWLRGVPEPA